MALYAEYASDCCVSKTSAAKNDRKEAIWRLVKALYEAINSDEPETHPLFAISDQLTTSGYERMFTCYKKGIVRIKTIIRQDVLKTEKRVPTGRTKGDLISLSAKDVAQPKKKRKESSTEGSQHSVTVNKALAGSSSSHDKLEHMALD